MNSRHDDGFTVIELLIAMVVMGLVMGATAAAFVLGIGATDQATRTLTVSQDAAFTSAQFEKDVQSATSVSLTAQGCPGPGTLVLSLSWTLPDQAVDYRYSTAGGAGRLTRTLCGTRTGTELTARALQAAPQPGFNGRTVSLTLEGQDGTTTTLTASRRTP